jgi:hypothetical protein
VTAIVLFFFLQAKCSDLEAKLKSRKVVFLVLIILHSFLHIYAFLVKSLHELCSSDQIACVCEDLTPVKAPYIFC